MPREIVAVNEHVPEDLIAWTVVDETVHESEVEVAYEMDPSAEPADGDDVTVLVSPNFKGEAGGVIEIVRVARLTVSAEETIVTAVYESVSDEGATGVIM